MRAAFVFGRPAAVLLCLLLCCAVAKSQGTKSQPLRVMFWNVENFFDTRHDTLKSDYEFMPRGTLYWTHRRFEAKRNQIFKTIVALGEEGGRPYSDALMPALVGLAEVENDAVLRELCQGTPMAKYHYQFVHYESPDVRGIDVALLYRPRCFRVLESKALCMSDTDQDFRTRDILQVFGVASSGDSLVLFVCHFPSKRGGKEAEMRRAAVARHLMQQMDSALCMHPTAVVLAMGDFNATPQELAQYVPPGLLGDAEAPIFATQADSATPNNPNFVNLMSMLPSDEGSYFYQGRWSYIDQFIISRNALQTCNVGNGTQTSLHLEGNAAHVFRTRSLLMEDKRHLGQKPRRTYQGPRYNGGASDHLPIYLTLVANPG